MYSDRNAENPLALTSCPRYLMRSWNSWFLFGRYLKAGGAERGQHLPEDLEVAPSVSQMDGMVSSR